MPRHIQLWSILMLCIELHHKHQEMIVRLSRGWASLTRKSTSNRKLLLRSWRPWARCRYRWQKCLPRDNQHHSTSHLNSSHYNHRNRKSQSWTLVDSLPWNLLHLQLRCSLSTEILMRMGSMLAFWKRRGKRKRAIERRLTRSKSDDEWSQILSLLLDSLLTQNYIHSINYLLFLAIISSR